jgi:TolA-binding protein
VTGSELDIAPLIVWIVGLSTLLSFGTTVWNLVNSGSKQNARRIGELEHLVEALRQEVTRLGDRLGQMPDQAMMHRLELSLARMEGHIDRLDERLKPVAAIAERMQEVLIEQGRK